MSKEILHSFAYKAAQALSVLVLLLSAYAFNRQSEFVSQCLNSGLVDTLVFFSEDASIANCQQSGWQSSAAPVRSQQLRRWTSAIDSLRSFWPRPKNSIQAIVIQEEPFAYSIGRNHILIGGVLTQSQRHWQAALTEAWLTQTAFGVSSLERNILADFLVAVLNGRFVVPSLSGFSGHPEETVAIGYFDQTPQQYCISDFRHPSEQADCTEKEGQAWRSFLARGLWRIYEAANLSERRTLRRWLSQDVALGSDSLVEDGNLKDAAWAKAQIWRWSKKILNSERQEIFLSRLERQLGLDRIENPAVALQVETLPDGASPSTPLLIRQNGQWRWWLGRETIPALAPKVAPRHVVAFNCATWPNTTDISAEASVLYMEDCAGTQLQGWEDLADGDLNAFIAANPEVSLLWLNARALRKLDRAGLPLGRLSLKQMRHISLWQEDRWDPSLRVFRPRAAIDLVLGHRASRNML